MKQRADNKKKRLLPRTHVRAGEHDHLTDHNWQLEIEGVTTSKIASP